MIKKYAYGASPLLLITAIVIMSLLAIFFALKGFSNESGMDVFNIYALSRDATNVVFFGFAIIFSILEIFFLFLVVSKTTNKYRFLIISEKFFVSPKTLFSQEKKFLFEKLKEFKTQVSFGSIQLYFFDGNQKTWISSKAFKNLEEFKEAQELIFYNLTKYKF